jgi:wyosine [tRNA(Phe)-imidazoG37] synthetase (radical SAM superfamily)
MSTTSSALKAIDLQSGIIYGPVSSRRLGKSLGVNPLPVAVKFCNFDCPYCQYPASGAIDEARKLVPSADAVLAAIGDALGEYAARGEKLDDLCFAGNGEPTLHPEFPRLIEETRALCDTYQPGLQISVLTNATTCGNERIRAALQRADLPILKLDAGTEATFQAVDKPQPGITLEKIVAMIKTFERPVLQTMLHDGAISNLSEDDLKGLARLYKEINPRFVMLYSLDRAPLDSRLEKIPADRLQAIGARLARESGVDVEVF